MVIWVVVEYNIAVVFIAEMRNSNLSKSKAPVEPCLPPAGRRQYDNIIESLILCRCGSSGFYPLAFAEAQHVENTPEPLRRNECVSACWEYPKPSGNTENFCGYAILRITFSLGGLICACCY